MKSPPLLIEISIIGRSGSAYGNGGDTGAHGGFPSFNCGRRGAIGPRFVCLFVLFVFASSGLLEPELVKFVRTRTLLTQRF